MFVLTSGSLTRLVYQLFSDFQYHLLFFLSYFINIDYVNYEKIQNKLLLLLLWLLFLLTSILYQTHKKIAPIIRNIAW